MNAVAEQIVAIVRNRMGQCGRKAYGPAEIVQMVEAAANEARISNLRADIRIAASELKGLGVMDAKYTDL